MKKKILVVEDREDARALIRLVVEKQGHTVLESAGAYDAIAKAEEYLPDLILMDIGLPLLDGLSTAKMIREMDAFERTPIIVVTGFRNVRDHAERAGCDDVIYKPIDPAELRRTLDKHLMRQ